ncbi:MAG TPA: PKD domain-containing protein [Solirubrobacteraceae bacterium]|nr:PKD domain-containing protein [Solirubrobacteraceae bacterium]
MRSTALAVLLVVCLIASPAAAASSPAPRRTRYATIRPACAPAPPGSATCFALVRTPVRAADAASRGVVPYTIGGGAYTKGPAEGFTPADLASAYGFSPAGGAGQTVALIDAYDDPKIEEGLAKFDTEYKLGECTKADSCFRKVNEEGSEEVENLPPKDEEGWSEEISLDVETVRAVCNGCKILLVEATSSAYHDLAKAANEAAALGATEISNSYGGPEIGLVYEEAAYNEAAYRHPGIVVTAATGDYGYDDWNYLLFPFELEPFELPDMPNAPASLPSVVSVGGTSLHLNGSGTREEETVWNDDGPYPPKEFPAGYVDGSGCSTLFPAQPWQSSAAGWASTGCGGKRLSADVSADADPATGFDVYDNYNFCTKEPECKKIRESFEKHPWETFGGTSLSAPIIAGLYALAGGANGLPYPALALYGRLGDAAALYDVTQGGDGICAAQPKLACGEPNVASGATLDCEGTSSCDARVGLDGPTGVGTPNGISAFQPVFPTAVATPPATILAGVPAAFSSASSSDPYPGGTIAGWSWAWGDGSAGAATATANPTHTYAAPGSYTLSLKVTDSYGLASAVSEQTVHVVAPPSVSPPVGGSHGAAAFSGSGTPPVPDAQLASTSLQVSASGWVTVQVTCPAGESVCDGSVTLRTLGAVNASARSTARKKVLTLASASFSAAGGHAGTVKLRLSVKARRLLGSSHSHSLRALAIVLAHDSQGDSHTSQATVTLHAPKAHHHKG